jgi:hypothetical protein
VEEFKRQLEETRQQSAKEVETHVEEIRRLAGEAKGLNYAMSLFATAKHYGTEADTEKKAADRLRIATIALALAAAAVALFAVFHEPDETRALIAKLAVSAILGGLAGYTAQQSGRHRARASRARSLQLELIAFSPFIEPLDAEQKEEERVILTRKTFTGGVWADATDFQDPGPTPVSLLMKRRLRGRGQGETEAPDDGA